MRENLLDQLPLAPAPIAHVHAQELAGISFDVVFHKRRGIEVEQMASPSSGVPSVSNAAPGAASTHSKRTCTQALRIAQICAGKALTD